VKQEMSESDDATGIFGDKGMNGFG